MRVNGPKGELHERMPRDMTVEQQDGGEILVTRPTDRGEHRALHGLTRILISNMVVGVTEGFEKRWRSRASATAPSCRARSWSSAWATRTRSTIEAPEGIEFEVPHPDRRSWCAGVSKQLVGEIAAQHPQAAPAGALQGQGHPLRGRARGSQGR